MSSESSQQDELIPKRTPLPKFQLFLVFLVQFAEPVTATVIAPFVNQFVRDTGIIGGDERKTGYYAGVIGSVFFFAEALTVFHWGWASDRVGRRPILLLGPVGLSLAMLSFGMSHNYWILVVSRAIQGVFNGNIGVSKTVIAEITDSTNIADAFAIMPMTWSIGSTIGPILGGILSEPAKRWPQSFGRFEFFHTHAYFLPCAAAGLFSLLSGAIAFVGLKETLPSAIANEKRKRAAEASVETSIISSDSTTPLLTDDTASYGSSDSTGRLGDNELPSIKGDANAPPPFRTLLVPQVMTPQMVYMVLAFVDMSSQILLPLVYSTSIPVGGLGLDPYHIGIILSVFGFVNAIVQLTMLGRLIRRFGPRNVYFVAQISYVVNIGLYPFLIHFARQAGRVDSKVWVVIVAQLVSRLTNGMAWGAIQIIIVDSAPTKAALGAVNGMAQALGSVSRSIGPSVASSLFSITLERNLAGGNMVYLVLAGS
ncbi:hypothetical protein D9615_005771 [Tricholomella constricta]|uniref:Major facilitator superfamily (MFS) profile domain-containing protein n=1 Tax=Tricholomella constricta TaxID=117010 RepID=A0A8H5M3T6_9AGAR|nr:hypothetical protein D9615_005771 [Tricholomella constricta]